MSVDAAEPARPLAAAPNGRRARPWLVLLKLAVTTALVAWLISEVSLGELRATLARTDLWLFAAVVLLRFGTMSLSALKWQQLLAVHGAHYPFNRLQGWYFISLFLSQFLPSLIGGDAYRIYKTYRNSRARAVAVLAVLMDRVTGLIALFALGFAAAIYVWLDGGDEVARAVVAIGAAFFAALAVGLRLVRSRHRQAFTGSRFCPRPLASLIEHADEYRGAAARGRLGVVWAASFAFHAIRIGTTWMLLYAIGVTADLAEVAVAVVAVNVAGMLPISLGGIGLMEGSFVLVMGNYGVAPEAALVAMLLSRATLLPMFVAAGAYFVLERRHEEAGEVVPAVAGDPRWSG